MTMTREEAINRFKGIIESFSISIAQSKFYPSKDILNELCDMAIDALQFQDIMINNPKSVKPTPEVCKNCHENNRPKGEWTNEGGDE